MQKQVSVIFLFFTQPKAKMERKEEQKKIKKEECIMMCKIKMDVE